MSDYDITIIDPWANEPHTVALPPTMFYCDECELTFPKDWSDEESQAELDENFPGLTKEDASCVCDDCYRKCMGLAPLENVS